MNGRTLLRTLDGGTMYVFDASSPGLKLKLNLPEDWTARLLRMNVTYQKMRLLWWYYMA